MSEVLEENVNCAQTHATFRILADDLIPDEISATLRVAPSATATKGQANPLLHSPTPVASRTGYWMLTSEGSVKSRSLEAHLVHLLDQLDLAKSEITRLSESTAIRVEFHCFWMSETGHGGPGLSAGVLRRIAALGADLQFDLYFSGD